MEEKSNTFYLYTLILTTTLATAISQQSDATIIFLKVDSLRILNTTRERRKNLIIFERII
jgi:hypothetical protein